MSEPELTDEQRKMIDELAKSISSLCHAVIRKRLEQFFKVIGEEIQKADYEIGERLGGNSHR